MATFIRALGTRLRSPFVQLSLGSTALGVVGSFQYQPKVEDFFHQTFITRKDPDAVVDFYSTEDFLQILGVFPLAIHFVLAGVDWDTKRENTMDVWGSMQISFDITEKEEEINGKDVVTFFNKRERFNNYVPLTNIVMCNQPPIERGNLRLVLALKAPRSIACGAGDQARGAPKPALLPTTGR